MCKTLPVLFLIGNSLQRAPFFQAIKYHPKTGPRSSCSRDSEHEKQQSLFVVSVDCRRRQQVDLFPLTFNDSRPYLGRSFTLLPLLVGVVQLFETGRALSSVGILKAAVETIVAHAVAIAVARLLMEHGRYLRSEFVGVCLIRVLGVSAPQLTFAQYRRQLGTFRRR